MHDLDHLVAQSMNMKEIASDEEVSDTEDDDLLAELHGLSEESEAVVSREPTPPTSHSVLAIVNDRVDNYQLGLASARSMNDGSKVRRLERGLKTLQSQAKQLNAGKMIAEDDIPPAIVIRTTEPPPSEPIEEEPLPPPPVFEPTVSTSTEQQPMELFEANTVTSVANGSVMTKLSEEDQEVHNMLMMRRNQYKTAAVQAKHNADETAARRLYRTAKQFDVVIRALEEGKPVDLTQMPPSPPGMADVVPVASERMQGSSSPEQNKSKLFHAPESASTVLEALQQRLAKYEATSQAAKEEGSSSKARRMGRIVKQYQSAIKAYKAKQPINFDDLPCPPGFPPIPGNRPKASPTEPLPPPPPLTIKDDSPVQPSTPQVSSASRAESQALFLQERQLQFKKAALIAKKNGDLALARNYLRLAKGFDQMIQASHSGLPVDMSQVPPPPGSSSVGHLEFIPANENGVQLGDRDEAYKKLEQDLIQQIRTCTSNADHFTKLGDVTSATRFDKMGQNSRKDLAALKNAFKHGDPVPRFHYETRSFTLVQSCTDLGDNSLEIQIIRGINLCLPSGYSSKDLDTYVKYEFPYPNDEPQKGESDICKHTNNPEYNQCFKLDINRKSRAFLRLLKSNKFIKGEIYYKRGFLKSDKLLGTANVKLLPLETQCEIHDSFDLMDGRKSIGGKLEMKIRVRHPFISKQVEEVKERWLVIDNFERKLQPPQQNQMRQKSPNRTNTSLESSDSASPPLASTYVSMEVLKYERQMLDQQILRYKGKLTPNEEEAMKHKSELLTQRVEETRDALRKGGVATLKIYADAIEKTQNVYLQEARSLVQTGNRVKAQTIMTKKKLVEREVEAIRAKLPS
ncbi:hypothetical protein CAPTEDRAFT_161585 [Capitella teleta]|uniref:C2 domain-containing protein n=1 Tax=Capitella teleta TaxID=283909 RepID=N1PB65_CAPTE|nr:hypothetical protein CAPTEDRAFT_161585 [Capitella teleta]|eukprot:ELU18816.1 hypothetical protein CAPTEDRAFT_161585 [Capitella teleta]